MNDSTKPVLVVGGGVIGAACAHYLAEAGLKVVVIDRALFGEGCSLHNCGYVCPSHVLPLTEPGAVGATLLGMLKPNSPFSVKLRPDLRLAHWFFRFALRCNEADMMVGARAIHPLLKSSMSLYRELLANDEFDCDWQEKGLLYVYEAKEKFESYSEINELLTRKFEEPATRLEGDALYDLEPALKPGLAGGWHYEGDAHLRSDMLMTSWKASLLSKGVRIVENCALNGLRDMEDAAVVAETDSGEIEASHVVMATGALSPKLANVIGWRAPIQPGKGYSLTMPRPKTCPDIPLVFPETRVAVTPFSSGYRLGSTMEFSGYDETLNPKRVDLLRKGAEPFLLEPYCEPIETTWYGWRPMTYDSVPIIGTCPERPKVTIATGHNMLGLSMAPATGKLVAELVTGTTPHLTPEPYSPDRF